MVPYQVGRPVEPEERETAEDTALVGDRRREHRVERTDAVGRHDQQPIADLVDVAHLAARDELQRQIARRHQHHRITSS